MGAAMIRHRRVSDVPAGAEPLASWIVAATSGAQHERWRAVNGPNQLLLLLAGERFIHGKRQRQLNTEGVAPQLISPVIPGRNPQDLIRSSREDVGVPWKANAATQGTTYGALPSKARNSPFASSVTLIVAVPDDAHCPCESAK
jgi:hypothetical protein